MQTSPTVQRRRLAGELRKLRESKRLGHADVADMLSWSASKVYKIEAALVGTKPRDLTDLLDIYGVDDPGERERLSDRARASTQPGWWRKYRDVISAQYSEYIGLETEACEVQTYQPQLIPGLFQTETYARALAAGAYPDQPIERFERQVAVRMARQARLFEASPLRVWAIVNEEVLMHVVGDLGVMREQVRWLFRLIELPHVNLQILRTGQGAHPGVTGSFSMLSFAEPTDADVAYVGCPAGELYLEEPDDVQRCRLALNHLRTKALEPNSTSTYLKVALRQYDDM
ncbi:MAG TPA: helix-turn-helix transcriptional regulator [Actinophytocola sp.]|uniref:helix-turn-helix domain-containing protein n=1 Tax=Actinophytocola sp. TaxID=1872138 RepID=UPI002E0124A3|nr:helix-turn-helix transcriptional regulator [Actinophytocola sp.]